MPSSIIFRPTSNDTRIVLQNSNFARQHGISSSWQTIRLGIRWVFGTVTQASIISSPILAAGFCSGNSDGSLILDSQTQHFVGVYNSAATMTWASDSGFGPTYAASLTLAKRLSTTFITNSANSTATGLIGASAETMRFPLFVDLIKGSPNYTIRTWYHNGADVRFIEPTSAEFLAMLELNNPVWNNLVSLSGTLAVDEVANGTLDNVTIAWNRTPQTIEISDIAVCRLA